MKLKKRIIRLLACTALIVMASSLHAVKYPVISYQSSDGLPQNLINTLTQDNLGYIFVGTQSGIGKFDGNQFQVITRKDGLPNNFVNQFEKDTRGNIWVATQEGLAKIDFIKRNSISSYLKSQNIIALKNDPQTNTMWIVTKTDVQYFKNGVFSHFFLLDYLYKEEDEMRIKGLAIAGSTIYFFNSSSIIEVNNGKIIQTTRCNSIIHFVKNLKNKLIVGTNKGIFKYENNLLIPYIELPVENRYVTDIVSDEKDRTWIGTNEGLLIYNDIDNPSDFILITDKNGLSSRIVLSLLRDREQNIFVGTNWGLAHLSNQLFKMYDESDGLPQKSVWNYIEYDNSILMTCDNGIVRLDQKTGKLSPFPINPAFKDKSIRVIFRKSEDEFLLGTREHGIYLWNIKTSRLDFLKKARTISGLKSPDNTYWFGTDSGLLHYDGIQFKRFNDGLKDPNVWVMAQYDSHSILVGTSKGVQMFREGKAVPSLIEKQIDENTVINDIKVFSPSEIMVATEMNGAFIIRNKEVKRLSTSNWLLSNDIWSIIKDNNGNIWLNTSVSLDRYTGDFISHFSKKTGLFGEEGSIHAGFKSTNGNLYIAITPGVVEIPPQISDINIKKPILYIKEVKVNNKVSPLDVPHLFSYNSNTIEFSYIAVSTRKENPILYKTRLIPLEKQWSEPSRETHIKYPKLPPDDYTFEVIANNGGGNKQWFKSVNRISFTIIKPYWHKWWFILFVIAVVGLLIFGIIELRLKSLARQKQILEKLVKKRTEELGLKNQELQYLSITDPLTDLKNRRYLEEKIKEDISLIERYIFDKTKAPERHSTGIPLLGVFILDIDYFKKVNDDYGHKAGDIVIVDIAKLLLEMLRNSDTIVRWGGEEFLIITRQIGKDSSSELAERIRKKIESYEFKIDEHTVIHKTVSVGYSHFPMIANDIKKINWHQVISVADSALYIAKNNGRNLSVGIDIGERELDIDFKDIVSNIDIGIEKKYLKLVCAKTDLVIPKHKS